MIRDMDMIRDLLLEIEGGRTSYTVVSDDVSSMLGIPEAEDGLTREAAAKLEHHLGLLEQRRLIEVKFKSGAGAWSMIKLTWDGHEFIEAVRDKEIWNRTKELSKKGGLATIEAVWKMATEVAKGYVKQRTGLDI
jgi:hypothetical protein